MANTGTWYVLAPYALPLCLSSIPWTLTARLCVAVIGCLVAWTLLLPAQAGTNVVVVMDGFVLPTEIENIFHTDQLIAITGEPAELAEYYCSP